jgi:hypothetical protein
VGSCCKVLSDEVVHANGFGTGDVDGCVERFADGDVGEDGGDVCGGDGLHEGWGHADGVDFGGGLGDVADELEELRGADDRVGNARGLDEVFLGELGAEITVA